MTPPNEQDKALPSTDFERAEELIRQKIAKMGDETHVEYDSTMNRIPPPPKWRQRLHKLLRLHS